MKNSLIKKEKIELNKKLIELVPMVEKFNLMGKEMGKAIECGLSVDYKFYSDGEII